MSATSVVLFTRDLRVHDQPALAGAAEADLVVPLFVFDDDLLARRAAPNRLAFLLESLADLRTSLRDLGADLVIRRGDVEEEVHRIVSDTGASALHVSADVSRWAHRRQRALERLSRSTGCRLVLHEGVTVVPPGELTTTAGGHYKVFTPYWRRWRAEPWRALDERPWHLRLPSGVLPGVLPALGDLSRVGGWSAEDVSPFRPPGGEAPGRTLLEEWFASGGCDAGDARGDLGSEGTSRLSPYLRFGCVSAREAAGLAVEAGADEWLRQLCWRDFHHQVADEFDAIVTEEYRSRGDRWRGDGPEAHAWRQGRTGVPIVDAGMRQLRAEGWMHNRARLITASFLTKHLYVDWRIGAEHFWRWLVDADVANNYGGWQWVAGTGNDTRPNRVLNPLRQAQRFDPEGRYVRRWVPELADIPGPTVHQPWRLPDADRLALDYPEPIIDVDERGRAFVRHRRLSRTEPDRNPNLGSA